MADELSSVAMNCKELIARRISPPHIVTIDETALNSTLIFS